MRLMEFDVWVAHKMEIIFKDLEVDGHNKKWKEAVSVFQHGDKAGALFRFKRLAKEGCAPALVEVGNIYEQGGGGVDGDLNEAIKWYSRSVAVLDDPKAHLGLGRVYLALAKSSADYLKAYQHLSLLEDREDMGALYGLGLMYEFGLGLEKNTQKAFSYYQSAAKLGHILAQRDMSRILIRQSFFKGFFMWLDSCVKIWRVALKKPGDKRLGIY